VSADDEVADREAILARRARFVATALVGFTVLPACDPSPRPCLNISEVPRPPTASAEPSSSAPPTDDAAAPQPCLEIVPPSPPPLLPPSASSSGQPDAGPKEAQPLQFPAPCLSLPLRTPDGK
jgi:hypothetical protein